MKSTGQPVRVRDRMTRTVATTHPEVPVMAARDLMKKRGLRHLPVVDQRERLVGIVTDRDLRQVVFAPALRARLRLQSPGAVPLPGPDDSPRRP